ncbi:unnamed protein product [Durusdinium trenchii]|uniref:DNA helicase n=1 Tax=Durusdinium trenchii TaxID=1381693 RepID=A0ABP0IV40_9DINO
MNRWCFHSDQAAASRIPCVSDFLKKFFRASIDPVFQVLAHAESCLLEALDKAHESLEDVQKAEHVAKCLSISESSLAPGLAWLHGRVSTLSRQLRSKKEQPMQTNHVVNLSTTQRQVIEFPHSVFLQGRSGTGKTVCIIQRILHRSRLFPDARRLFITRSSLLCENVADELGRSLPLSRHFTRGSKLLCLTWDQLVQGLLPNCPGAIQYSTFLASFWPALKPPAGLDPLLVWAEFHNKLRSFDAKPPVELHGRVTLDQFRTKQALSRAGNCLTLEQYTEQTTACIGVPLRKDQLQDIYSMFAAYLQRKMTGGNQLDSTDVAALIRSSQQVALFEELYVDEAQDFSPAELTALLCLCGRGDGVMIAGDTCQTINPGSAFSFKDIILAFQNINPKPLQEPSDPCEERFREEALLCAQMSLGFNHRSSPQIVQLANTVSELLIKLFPASVDSVEEKACGSGGKPPVCSSDPAGVVMGTGALALRILDSTRCAVLVRTNACRNRLRCLGVRGTILTIAEAKGLEFDFVVLYDYFSACPLRDPERVWQTVSLVEEIWQGRIGSTKRFSHPASTAAIAAALIPELKHLYVGITRARFGCAFVESAHQVQQKLVEHWRDSGLVVFVTDDNYCEMAKASREGRDFTENRADFTEKKADKIKKAAVAERFSSLDDELAWILSELKQRIGSEHKLARKMLGQERMRLQSGKCFDPFFAFKVQAAHGPILSQKAEVAAKSRQEHQEHRPDFPSIVEVLRLRSNYHTGSSSLSSAIQHLKERGRRLLRHALDDQEQRWPVFEEARAIFEEALRCSSKLLDEQLRNKGRFALEDLDDLYTIASNTQSHNAKRHQQPDGAKIVQLVMAFRSRKLRLKDDMFHDMIQAEDASGEEVILVNATLLSGRELPEFAISVSATVDDLHAQLERTLGGPCRLILKGDGFLNVSALEGSLSLSAALAKTIASWETEIEWHRSICVILELQRCRSPLSRLKIPNFWERVFTMTSTKEVSEAQAGFRLTVERFLEYEQTQTDLQEQMQIAQAWFLRTQSQFSTFMLDKEREAATSFSKLLDTQKATASKILGERPIVTTKQAVRSLLASAQMLQAAQDTFVHDFIPASTQRMQDFRRAAEIFHRLGDIQNAALDYERAASAGFQFLNRWRSSTLYLGRKVRSVFRNISQDARESSSLAAFGFMCLDRTSLEKAGKSFLKAGRLREADALAVWISPAKCLLSPSSRRGVLLYSALVAHDLSSEEHQSFSAKWFHITTRSRRFVEVDDVM